MTYEKAVLHRNPGHFYTRAQPTDIQRQIATRTMMLLANDLKIPMPVVIFLEKMSETANMSECVCIAPRQIQASVDCATSGGRQICKQIMLDVSLKPSEIPSAIGETLKMAFSRPATSGETRTNLYK